jgi:hypothetical protein
VELTSTVTSALPLEPSPLRRVLFKVKETENLTVSYKY